MLKQYANVDTSYSLTPEDLCAKMPLCDALIVRSGTKVRSRQPCSLVHRNWWQFSSTAGPLQCVGPRLNAESDSKSECFHGEFQGQ